MQNDETYDELRSGLTELIDFLYSHEDTDKEIDLIYRTISRLDMLHQVVFEAFPERFNID